jgi:hypothetical protein
MGISEAAIHQWKISDSPLVGTIKLVQLNQIAPGPTDENEIITNGSNYWGLVHLMGSPGGVTEGGYGRSRRWNQYTTNNETLWTLIAGTDTSSQLKSIARKYAYNYDGSKGWDDDKFPLISIPGGVERDLQSLNRFIAETKAMLLDLGKSNKKLSAWDPRVLTTTPPSKEYWINANEFNKSLKNRVDNLTDIIDAGFKSYMTLVKRSLVPATDPNAPQGEELSFLRSKNSRAWRTEFQEAVAVICIHTFASWYQNRHMFELWTDLRNAGGGGWGDTLDTDKITQEDLEKLLDNVDKDLNDAAGTDELTAAKDEKLTKKEIDDRQKYLKQCALMLNLGYLEEKFHNKMWNEANGLTNIKSKIHTKRKGIYEGKIHLIQNQPDQDKGSIMTNLLAPQQQAIESFLNMTPDLQSALVPKIRLFKVFNNGNNELEEIEFIFPAGMDPNDSKYRVSGDIFRGGACGIKDFSWSFEGTTPATATKVIQASLKLYFQDFKELVKVRKEGEFFKQPNADINKLSTNTYKYIDLILLPFSGGEKTGLVNEDTGERIIHPFQFDPKNYRIRVDVGWVIRDDEQFINLLKERDVVGSEYLKSAGNVIDALLEKQKDLQKPTSAHRRLTSGMNNVTEALRLINKSFYLNMVDHELDFRDDGSVEIEISYQAYMESAFKTHELDALITPELNYAKQQLSDEYYEILRSESCDPIKNEKVPKDAYVQLLNTYQQIQTNYIREATQSLINRLIKRERVYYAYVSAENVRQFAEDGFFRKQPFLIYPTAKTLPEKINVDINEQALIEEEEERKKEKTPYQVGQLDGKLESFVEESRRAGDQLITYFFLGDLIHIMLDCMNTIVRKKKPNNIAGWSSMASDPIQTLNKSVQESITVKRNESGNPTALSQLKKGELGPIKAHLKNMKVLLSSYDYINWAGLLVEGNIAGIPISMEFFLEWMTQNVIKPSRKSYPIAYFIRDICNKLLIEIMGDICSSRQLQKNLRFNTTTLLGVGHSVKSGTKTVRVDPFRLAKQGKPQDGGDFINNTQITNVTSMFRKGLIPLQGNIETSDRGMKDVFQYFVVYPIQTTLRHTGRGNFYEDGYNGKYHLVMGSDRGLLKRVKFTKTDIQYLREARFFNHGHDGLLQLSAVYKISLDLFGNTLFYPGMEIFLDPVGVGGEDFDPTIGGSSRSVANALGIGGYHIITRVKSSISPNGFTTNVEAMFVYSGDGNSSAFGVGATPKTVDQLTSEDITRFNNTNKDKVDTFCEQVILFRTANARNILSDKYSINSFENRDLINELYPIPKEEDED